MNCKKCGSPLLEGAEICSICGSPVEEGTPEVKPEEVKPAEPAVPEVKPEEVKPVEPVTPEVKPEEVKPEEAKPEEVKPEPVPPVEPVLPVDPIDPVKPAAAPAAPVPPTPPAPEKKNNNMIYIGVCVALAVVIIVLLVLVLNKDDDKEKGSKDTEKTKTKETTKKNDKDKEKEDDDKTTKKTTTSKTTTTAAVTPTGGNYYDYYGYQLYVPDSFTTEDVDGLIGYVSNSKRQMLLIELENGSYSQAEAGLEAEVATLESSGMEVISSEKNTHNGMKYCYIKVKQDGMTLGVGYAEFSSGMVLGFIMYLDYAKEADYLDTVQSIVANSKTASSFSKNDNNKISIDALIKNKSKLSLD